VTGAAPLLRVQRAMASRSGRRRRQWIVTALAGGAALAWVATGEASASVRWLWASVTLFSVAMLRVPFVLFWRDDAALLARLPVRGRPLFDAAMVATASLAAQALLPALVAAAPLALLGEAASLELFARHAALAGAMAVAAGAGIPAVAVGAGALVVSGKAQQMLSNMGPELPAPPTSWLGVLPGVASASVVLAAINLGGWLRGGQPELGSAGPLLVGMVAVSGAAAVLARSAAERVMPAMLRDVSALDRQRLAPLELTPPPATLRLAQRWLEVPSARLVDKHALLVGRRYPMAAVIGAVVFATVAITSVAAPGALGVMGATLTLALAYAWILRGRLDAPPVELPRLLASLPFTDGQIAAARRAFVLWWWGLYTLLPMALVLARTPQPAVLGGVYAVATAALLFGLRRR
jgi:hypothetical protein